MRVFLSALFAGSFGVSAGADLFGAPGLHDARLTFTSDQWRALEPKQRDALPDEASNPRVAMFSHVHADLVLDGEALTNVAVRYKGDATYRQSRATLKRPFKVDLNEFVKGRKLDGLGKVNFHNNVADPGFMNEALAYALYRDAGVPAPRTAHARLTVTAAGWHTNRYLGLYTLVENPDQNWAEDRFGSRRGMILKPTVREPFRHLGDAWGSYREAYDPKTAVVERHARRVVDLSRLVETADDAEFARRLPEFLDPDAFARFMAVTVFVSSLDSILGTGEGYILYLDPATLRFAFIPWDLDQAFGNAPEIGTREARERLDIRRPWIGANRFLERVFAVTEFRGAYEARLAEFRDTLFRPERIDGMAARLGELLAPAVADEGPAVLARFRHSLAGVAVAPVGHDGQLPAATAVAASQWPLPVRAFVAVRHRSLAAQLAGDEAGLGIAPARGPENATGALAARVRSLADADRDGGISRREWTRECERWFGAWDSDRDGLLRTEEIMSGLDALMPKSTGAAGLEWATSAARRMAARFDRDHSGSVSRGEFALGMQERFETWKDAATGMLSESAVAAGFADLTAPGPFSRAGR